jgi:hypothetical protein
MQSIRCSRLAGINTVTWLKIPMRLGRRFAKPCVAWGMRAPGVGPMADRRFQDSDGLMLTCAVSFSAELMRLLISPPIYGRPQTQATARCCWS